MIPSTDPCTHTQDDINAQAIKHVFINIIRMDQGSFQQVCDWFQFLGISALDHLLEMQAYIVNPKYKVHGQTRHLDSWITNNLISIPSFIQHIYNTYKIFMESTDWLRLKRDRAIYLGFKIHDPPKSNPKPTWEPRQVTNFGLTSVPSMGSHRPVSTNVQVPSLSNLEAPIIPKISKIPVSIPPRSQPKYTPILVNQDPIPLPSKEPDKEIVVIPQLKTTLPSITPIKEPLSSAIEVSIPSDESMGKPEVTSPTHRQNQVPISNADKSIPLTSKIARIPVITPSSSHNKLDSMPSTSPRPKYTTPAIDKARIKKEEVLAWATKLRENHAKLSLQEPVVTIVKPNVTSNGEPLLVSKVTTELDKDLSKEDLKGMDLNDNKDENTENDHEIKDSLDITKPQAITNAKAPSNGEQLPVPKATDVLAIVHIREDLTSPASKDDMTQYTEENYDSYQGIKDHRLVISKTTQVVPKHSEQKL